MRIFYFELLLFSLTLAAPTLKPQAEKTKQDCVEEQRSPGASLLWTSVSQSLPDTHLMPWPKPCLASRPAIAHVMLVGPSRKKKTKVSLFPILARE
uniref:Matrix extracellular phosphoglycoprotein n=1 Tax=Ovis aries TaxID=9940 RepID=A0AC11CJ53_SHEEP